MVIFQLLMHKGSVIHFAAFWIIQVLQGQNYHWMTTILVLQGKQLRLLKKFVIQLQMYSMKLM